MRKTIKWSSKYRLKMCSGHWLPRRTFHHADDIVAVTYVRANHRFGAADLTADVIS
jgi:hypothetical protein